MLQVIVNVFLEKFQLQQREAWAMQKLFRKSIEKMDKRPRYKKQWVLRCPPKKEKEDE